MRVLAFVLVMLPATNAAQAQADYGFRFVRIRFDDGTGGRGTFGGAAWAHDFPTAEENFHIALKRTTAIHVEEPYVVLDLSDDRIFEHPVLYLCEPGYWTLNEKELQNLRSYLERGGFILFDDFRGDYEWMNLYEQMKRVFPDIEPSELLPEHPIWSIYYDVDPVAAPSLVRGFGGFHGDDRYLGYFDDKGRLMALANHNQDIGDGWEYPNNNFDNASTVSFQMGINFVIWALSH